MDVESLDSFIKIKNAIQGAGYTIERFAEEKLGMPRERFNYHARKATIDKEFIEKIAKALPKSSNTTKRFNEDVKAIPQSEFMKVPVLRIFAQAGYFKGEIDDAQLDTMLVPKEYENGHYMVVEVKGDSMDDNSRRGVIENDKLLIKELPKELWTNKLHMHGNVWIVVTADGLVFKEIIKHDITKGIITLHSWNAFYQDYDVRLKDVYRLFYVKKLVERAIKS